MANSGVRDEGEIRQCIERAEFVKKGESHAPSPVSSQLPSRSSEFFGWVTDWLLHRGRGAVCIVPLDAVSSASRASRTPVSSHLPVPATAVIAPRGSTHTSPPPPPTSLPPRQDEEVAWLLYCISFLGALHAPQMFPRH